MMCFIQQLGFCIVQFLGKIHIYLMWIEELITIRVRGNGFLYNMVRILAGTLIGVGRGAIAPEQIPAILEAKDRQAAGMTVPPQGLTLVKIDYLDEKKQIIFCKG